MRAKPRPSKLPSAVRRLVDSLEVAYADPDTTDEAFTALVDTLGAHARELTDTQRAALSNRLAAARERAGRKRFLHEVAQAAVAGQRRLERVLDTGEEVWHIDLPSGQAIIVVPTVLPDMTAELADAIQRSRDATFTGRCACGGELSESGGTLRVEHTRRCPASETSLALLRARS